jgi:hypothetical protein
MPGLRGRDLTSHAERISRRKWRLVVNLPSIVGDGGKATRPPRV